MTRSAHNRHHIANLAESSPKRGKEIMTNTSTARDDVLDAIAKERRPAGGEPPCMDLSGAHYDYLLRAIRVPADGAPDLLLDRDDLLHLLLP